MRLLALILYSQTGRNERSFRNPSNCAGWTVMKYSTRIVFVFTLVIAASVARASEPLRLVRTIPLTNVVGRIDHLAADTDGRRLFVAALGNNTVEVIDLAAGKVVKSVGGLHEPQGVAFLK